MKEIPRKKLFRVECNQCNGTGESPYSDNCELCNGKGWYPEWLTLERHQ